MKKYILIFLFTIACSLTSVGQRTDTSKMKVRVEAQRLKQSATAYKKPLQLKDGIQTATLKDVGIDEKIIKAMQD